MEEGDAWAGGHSSSSVYREDEAPVTGSYRDEDEDGEPIA